MTQSVLLPRVHSEEHPSIHRGAHRDCSEVDTLNGFEMFFLINEMVHFRLFRECEGLLVLGLTNNLFFKNKRLTNNWQDHKVGGIKELSLE